MIEVQEGFNVRGALTEEEYWNQQKIIDHVNNIAHAFLNGDSVQPMIVRFNPKTQKVTLLDGHHRYKGLMKSLEMGADVSHVQVLEFRGDEAQKQLVMLQTSNSIELTAVEKAEVIFRLLQGGYEVSQIAKKIGKSASYVNNLLKVHELPLVVKRKIQLGETTLSAALMEADGVEKEAAPKKTKPKTPTKKTVLELMNIVSENKEPDITDGKVKIEIPVELWEKFILVQEETLTES